MSTIPQLAQLKLRMQQLNLQKARYGFSADPHIGMEYDDLSTVISQMELIDIHRRNLDHMIRQRDHFGANVPTYIINQIMIERAAIVQLREICARSGQNVPAHPLDDDAAPELPPIAPQQATQPKSDLHTRLDQAIALLIEIRAAL